jgi:hypothetical protein
VNGYNACYVMYLPSQGLMLSTNQGGWSAPIQPGANSQPYNSQCTLFGQWTSVSHSGNTLTLNASIAFDQSFVGNLQAFVYATDSGGADAGWQDVLSYTALSLSYPSATPGGSIAPISGAGASATFTVTSQDANGWKYIFTQHALVGSSSANLASSCLFVPLNWAGGTLYLLGDNGTTWLGPAYADSPSTLSNGQCSINSGSMTVSTNGNDGNSVTFTVGVDFKSGFTGLQNTYLDVTDQAQTSTGWLPQQGTWNVVPISIGSGSASPTGGSAATFTASASDTGGYGALTSLQLLINYSVNGYYACYVMYLPKSTAVVYGRGRLAGADHAGGECHAL